MPPFGNVVPLRPGDAPAVNDDHVFTKAMKDYLPECWEIGVERGGQYGDTWALENRVNTYKLVVLRLPKTEALVDSWLRLMDAASMLDIKSTRFLGGFKRDHVIDSINYFAAFGFLLEDYLKHLEPAQK
jgi:hypothetical protein